MDQRAINNPFVITDAREINNKENNNIGFYMVHQQCVGYVHRQGENILLMRNFQITEFRIFQTTTEYSRLQYTRLSDYRLVQISDSNCLTRLQIREYI